MDENREAAVWQRVSAGQMQRPPEPLTGLIRESAELTAVYRRLSERMPGNALIRKLTEEEQAVEATLRGIGVLSGGTGERVKLWTPEVRNPRKLLEGCYYRAAQCHREYMARCADGEFGGLFRLLADRELEQCARIARLLGEARPLHSRESLIK